jgi:hypothetical protein
MLLYNYDGITKEYLGSNEATFDPLEHTPMIPANATDTAPPAAGANQVAVWQGNQWALIPDFRGQVIYKKSDASSMLLKAIGEFSSEYTLVKPVCAFPVWNGTGWIPNMQVLAENLASKIESAAQALMDKAARLRGYDSMISVISYLSSSNPTWKADAEAGRAYRDLIWNTLRILETSVSQGQQPMPASIDEVMATLPVIVWPS